MNLILAGEEMTRSEKEAVEGAGRVRGERISRGITERVDHAAGAMFLLIVLGFPLAIKSAHGWPMGIFVFVLLVTILELAYRLANHD